MFGEGKMEILVQMTTLMKKLAREERGQDLIEYGLLIGVITVGAIAAILLVGPKVTKYFTNLSTALP